MKNKIDFIGDIHGYADRLKTLLYKMGYRDDKGYFYHPSRTALFVGDYIDRGPDNPGVVNIVRKMVENKTAIALMGNHEYNAIMFNMLGKKGYLRPHTIKNFKQHAETLLQYYGKNKEYLDTIEWFKTLPLFYEGKSFRACHASGSQPAIDCIKEVAPKGILSEQQFIESADPKSSLFHAVEATCKGLEAKLPKGTSFYDKDGAERFDIRIKWWENPKNKTYQEMSVIDIEMKKKKFDSPFQYYKKNNPPVFFGHYWLKGEPNIIKSNVCCLDYSVAKNGILVAYRFNGEQKLTNQNFVYV